MGISIRPDFQQGSLLFQKIQSIRKGEREEKELANKRRFRSIVDRYAPPKVNMQVKHYDSDLEGHKRIQTINTIFARSYRSPQQKDFHKAMLSTCLRIVFGKDFQKEKHKIMSKYEFEFRKQQLLICAPRRIGKTFATAFFAIAMAMAISGLEISIFSPGKRQSVALMNHIVTFIKKIGEFDRIISRNEEKMQFQSLDGQISKINAYPSAVRTLKGVSGSIIILEEMAQIDPAVLYEVIIPLHQLDMTCIIGISTITDENNFFTKYLKMEDAHGESLFSVKQIWLACKTCRDAGVAFKCNHNNHLLPDWSSPRKRKIINAMMKNQEELLAREIGGVASVLHQKAFPFKLVTKFKEQPPYEISNDYYYENVFVAIDPSGAGKSSDIAITSMIRHNGLFIIIGMESFPAISALETHGLIVAHCDRIRDDPRFSASRLVFILENNLALESEHIEHMLVDNVSNYIVMTERDDGRHTGFRTTNAMKTLAVENMREKLLDNALRVADKMSLVTVQSDYDSMVGTLIDQMTEFAEVLKESDLAKPRKFYSGKAAGKDDLIITLLMCMHWSGFFLTSPKYAHMH
jgi:hypothetical protein